MEMKEFIEGVRNEANGAISQVNDKFKSKGVFTAEEYFNCMLEWIDEQDDQDKAALLSTFAMVLEHCGYVIFPPLTTEDD